MLKYLTGFFKKELGARQKEYIKKLRDENTHQCFYINSKNLDRVCALGMANKVHKGYSKEEFCLDFRTCLYFGFRSIFGNTKKSDGLDSIVELNDSLKLNFNEIADIIEKNPEQYFWTSI